MLLVQNETSLRRPPWSSNSPSRSRSCLHSVCLSSSGECYSNDCRWSPSQPFAFPRLTLPPAVISYKHWRHWRDRANIVLYVIEFGHEGERQAPRPSVWLNGHALTVWAYSFMRLIAKYIVFLWIRDAHEFSFVISDSRAIHRFSVRRLGMPKEMWFARRIQQL